MPGLSQLKSAPTTPMEAFVRVEGSIEGAFATQGIERWGDLSPDLQSEFKNLVDPEQVDDVIQGIRRIFPNIQVSPDDLVNL
jgi:hypothetical protein